MSKTVVLAMVFILAAGIGGWYFHSQQPSPEVVKAAGQVDSAVVQEETAAGAKNNTEGPVRLYDDELSNETRIILVAPDDKELGHLLSEKVIRNGEIVDKINRE